jgi:hypothetical protein
MLSRYRQVFLLKNLTYSARLSYSERMGKQPSSKQSRPTAKLIRQRIERGGERLWRLEDFPQFSMLAVAQALSRLAREGELRRLSKGVYYRPRPTAFGPSRPNPAYMRKLVAEDKPVFPAGIAAANFLAFTTQMTGRSEVATSAGSLPRKLLGSDTVIHTRRPGAWTSLSEKDGALLDFLRRGGKTSELAPEETIRRTLLLLREDGRLDRLLKIAHSEPPRVRAILGALGEELHADPRALNRLRQSLNPLSRFDFGLLSALSTAPHWQAKGGRRT